MIQRNDFTTTVSSESTLLSSETISLYGEVPYYLPLVVVAEDLIH